MREQFEAFVKQHGLKDEQHEKQLKLKTLEAELAEARLAEVRLETRGWRLGKFYSSYLFARRKPGAPSWKH